MYELPQSTFAFLLHFVKKQKAGFFFIFLVSSIATIANHSLWPYITGDLVDKFASLSKDSVDQIIKPCMFALVFWIFIEFVQRSKGFLLAYICPKFEANIRQSSFEQIIRHSHTYFVHKHVGSIAHRIDDLPRSARLIVDDILTIFLPLIISILLSSTMFWHMHITLASIFFSWLICHFLLSIYFCIRSTKYAVEQSHARAVVQGSIVDSIRNHFNVRTFDAYDYELHNMQQNQQDQILKYRFVLAYIEKTKVILSCLAILGVSALLYSAIKLWMIEMISVGDIVFIVNSTLNIMTTMWFASDEISYIFNEIGVCKQSLQVIHEGITDDDSDKKPDILITEGKIEFQNVHFCYPNGHKLFEGKSLLLPGKQKIGLVGFSGSGKTTFAYLLMRIYDITQGRILIDNQDLSLVNKGSVRRYISFIQQEPILFHRSIRDNIIYSKPNASMKEIEEAAIKAHCHEFIIKMPEQYDTIVGETGAKLSGGQRQRIAIARAILKNAPILIMDEATSALDSVTEKKIQESLDYLMQDKTVIVIAHRMSTLLNMDRILVFQDGRIIEDGNHKELIEKKDGHYASLWHMQQSGILPDKKVVD